MTDLQDTPTAASGTFGKQPATPGDEPERGGDHRRAEVPVGVIGLGRIGKLHAHNLAQSVAHARLAVVADARPEVARAAGEQYGVPWSASPDGVLGDNKVRAVVIASPTPTHAVLIQRAASVGKHVLCEKPLAPDAERTAAAVAAAESAEIVLQVGFQIRYDPHFASVRSVAQCGGLGNIVLCRAALRDMQPPECDYLRDCGGLLVDGAIHLFDLARWMVGEIEQVTAVGAPQLPIGGSTADIDTCAVILRFVNGALGLVENCRCCGYGFECSAEIVGSDRTARIGAQAASHVEWLEGGRASVDRITTFTDWFAAAYLAEVQDFVAAILLQRPPLATGQDAVHAATIADAALRSLLTSKTVHVPGVSVPAHPRSIRR